MLFLHLIVVKCAFLKRPKINETMPKPWNFLSYFSYWMGGGEFEPMTLQSIRRAEPFKQFSA